MIRPQLVPYQRAKQPPSSASMSHLAAVYSLPTGTTILDHQVAGHMFEEGKDTIGTKNLLLSFTSIEFILKCLGILKDHNDGSILKSSCKPLCSVREIQFYEQLQTSRDDDRVILKQLVPDFRGTVTQQLGEKRVSLTDA